MTKEEYDKLKAEMQRFANDVGNAALRNAVELSRDLKDLQSCVKQSLGVGAFHFKAAYNHILEIKNADAVKVKEIHLSLKEFCILERLIECRECACKTNDDRYLGEKMLASGQGAIYWDANEIQIEIYEQED